MASITTREVKGVPLTYEEVDNNFIALNTDKAETDSPALTGTPTAPTAGPGTNTTQIATNEYVHTELNSYAPLASPALTGSPTAPTPSPNDNDTSIATTAFVQTELSDYAALASPTLTGNPTAPTPTKFDNDTSIATTAFVQTELEDFATLQSPALTGTPTAPTPPKLDDSTRVATTAHVKEVLEDYAQTEVGGYATILSPNFTGNPTAPTPLPGDNDTSIATTAYVQEELTPILSDLADIDASGWVTGLRIASGSVSESKLGTSSVTETKLSNAAVTEPKIANGAVNEFKLADGAVTTAKVANLSITSGKLATSAVSSGNIGNGAVTNSKIGAGAVTSDKLAAGLLTGFAPINSPAFTGFATGPSPATSDSSNQLATTAFVRSIAVNSEQTTGTQFVNTALDIGGAIRNRSDVQGNNVIDMLPAFGSTPNARWIHFSNGDITLGKGDGSKQIVLSGNNFRIVGMNVIESPLGRLQLQHEAGAQTLTLRGTGSGSGAGLFFAYNGSSFKGLQQISDSRLKAPVAEPSAGLALLEQLSPRYFEFTGHPTLSTPEGARWGFYAQELEPVLPTAVEEVEEPPSPSGEEVTEGLLGTAVKGLSQDAATQLCAVLAKALQEAVVKIESLEDRISVLEAA